MEGRRTTGVRFLDEGHPVLAFAHRGGANHPEIFGLENTMAAFRHATQLGYQYLETDVHLTVDGVLIAFHDDRLDRVTDQGGVIAERTYAEVSAALIGGREPIPTLAELLAELPHVFLNIDLKSDQAVAPLAQAICDSGAQERVLVGSFSRRRLKQFRNLLPEVPTSAAPLEVAVLRLLPWGGLANALVGRPVRALQVPVRRGPLQIVTRSFVRRMHRLGKHVHVWTIDSPEEMSLLLDRGVDGLMTDRTDILKAVLIDRGQWKGM